MLRAARDAVVSAGWRIVNVDCIVFAQRPRLGPYKADMGRRLAEILEVGPEQVGVKAKTGEGVGEVGREEVIAAQCVALLEATAKGPGFGIQGSGFTASTSAENPEPRTLNPEP
jgi:2-C-methyl-D-erythritol 2,4-cyclodiphosphate synthase